MNDTGKTESVGAEHGSRRLLPGKAACYLAVLLFMLAGLAIAGYFLGQGYAQRNGLAYRNFVHWIPLFATLLVSALAVGGLIYQFACKKSWKRWGFGGWAILAGSTITLFAGPLFCGTLALHMLDLPEERELPGGYLQLAHARWLEQTTYSYAEPSGALFRHDIEWGPEQDMLILEATHGITFSEVARSSDGKRRYCPEGYPGIAVRVYDISPTGVVDDLSYKVASREFLARYTAVGFTLPYSFNDEGQQGFNEGHFKLIYDGTCSAEEFARAAADLVAAASQDPLFEREIGWLECSKSGGVSSVLYFGPYVRFTETGKPFDYYADWHHVLIKLEEDGFVTR